MPSSLRRQRVDASQHDDADISLIFDGGSLGNPGRGYGSAAVIGLLHRPEIMTFSFDGQRTNNESEYLTLIHALRRILEELQRDNRDPRHISLSVLSDSMLVVEQLNGRWKVKNAGLRPLHAEAADLLRRFKFSSIAWHPREESVRILGH